MALALLQSVTTNEGHKLTDGNARNDRKYILDTYAECLRAVSGERRITLD